MHWKTRPSFAWDKTRCSRYCGSVDNRSINGNRYDLIVVALVSPRMASSCGVSYTSPPNLLRSRERLHSDIGRDRISATHIYTVSEHHYYRATDYPLGQLPLGCDPRFLSCLFGLWHSLHHQHPYKRGWMGLSDAYSRLDSGAFFLP